MIEALESVASPEVASRIVAEALAAAGLVRPPEHKRDLTRFARGQLRRAVQVVLGPDAAELVEQAVLGIATRLDDPIDPESTGVRWTEAPKAPREHAAAKPARAGTGAILIATEDLLRVAVVERAAESRTSVVHVRDLMSLLDAAQAEPRRAPLVIVDCLAPSVQLPTLAIVVPDLPRGSRVVVWGATDDAWLELTSIAGPRELGRFTRADLGDSGVNAAVRGFLG